MIRGYQMNELYNVKIFGFIVPRFWSSSCATKVNIITNVLANPVMHDLNAVIKKFGVQSIVDTWDEHWLDIIIDKQGQRLDDPSGSYAYRYMMPLIEHMRGFLMRNNINVMPIRSPSLQALFKLKCIALHERTKMRDVFDIVSLVKCHGFTINDIHSALLDIEGSHNYSIERALSKLTQTNFLPLDEPIDNMIQDNSPFSSMDDATQFITPLFQTWNNQQLQLNESVSHHFDGIANQSDDTKNQDYV